MNVEAIFMAVGCVGMHVGSISIPRTPVQVVVLLDHSPRQHQGEAKICQVYKAETACSK